MNRVEEIVFSKLRSFILDVGDDLTGDGILMWLGRVKEVFLE